MIDTIPDVANQAMLRAITDDFREEIDEQVSEVREKASRYAKELSQATSAFDESTRHRDQATQKLGERVRDLELRPRDVEVVKPVVENKLDMTPVALVVEQIGEHVTYAIKNIPVPKDIDLGPIADALAEGLGRVADALESQSKKIVAQNEILAKLVKAIGEQKPIEFKPSVTPPDLAGIEKLVGELAKVIKTLADKKSSERAPRKIKIVHGEKESTITES